VHLLRRLVASSCTLPVSVLFLTPTALAAPHPIIVCYGDSITAGYGLNFGESYPDLLQQKLDSHGYHYQVKNQGANGATTKNALAGIQSILRLHPEIVILQFGGNDAYNHFPADQTRQNLEAILTALDNAHIRVVLVSMALTPDYPPDYIHAFDQVFRDLAAEHHTAFVPNIYKDLVHVPGALQDDSVHPTAKGSEIVADTNMAALKPLLHK
jgi:acyl-CoA thioesterase-1